MTNFWCLLFGHKVNYDDAYDSIIRIWHLKCQRCGKKWPEYMSDESIYTADDYNASKESLKKLEKEIDRILFFLSK